MSTSATPAFSELQDMAAPPKELTLPKEQAAPPAEVKKEEAPPAETFQFTEADATAYRTLTDAGISVNNYADLQQKASALDNLGKLLDANPKLLFDEIEKTNPTLAARLEEIISDRWYEKNKHLYPEGKAPGANGSASSAATSTDPRIEALSQKLDNLVAARNQELSEKQQARITDGYENAVNGLLGKLPEGTPETTKDYIRLKANELLWKDTAARERVAKGVYVDVPKYFAEASKKATADTLASAKADTDRRETVKANAHKEITPAAENVNGAAVTQDKDENSWNITDQEIRAAYK
jgi:hypothetical protein